MSRTNTLAVWLLVTMATMALAASAACAYKMNLTTSESHRGYIYVDGGPNGPGSYTEYAYSTSDTLGRYAVLGTAAVLATSVQTTGTVFEGFHTEGGQTCHSSGEPAGTVATVPTTLELGYINKKAKEVGMEERPTSGTLYAEFTCGEDQVEMRGSYIGRLAPVNEKIKAGGLIADEVAIAPGTESDAITHFEGGPEAVLEIQVDGGGFHPTPLEDPGVLSVEEGTLKIKANGKTPPVFDMKEKKPKEKKK